MIEITGYKILKKIGQGGMAAVYLAKHKLLDREVAIKILQVGSFSDPGFRKSFIKEGQIIAKLEHPHIIKIYDIGIENEQFYMAMELVKNGSLKERIAKQKLSLEESLTVIVQVASALSYAHSKGYIHRDIKPANILYREKGDVVLTDFGIAKLQGVDSEMTQMGVMAGTPHYMAPEQGIGGDLDQRTDVYSLAVVLYELLAKKKPFDAANTVAVTYEHAHAEIPALPQEYAYLQPLIDKALAKKKEDRYKSVLAFSTDLQSRVSSEDATVIIPSAIPAHTEVQTKIPWKWLVPLFVILALGIAGFVMNNQYNALMERAEKSYEEEHYYDYSSWDERCVEAYAIDDLGGEILYQPEQSSQFLYRKAQKSLFSNKEVIAEKLADLEQIEQKIKSARCDDLETSKQERESAESGIETFWQEGSDGTVIEVE